MFASGRTNVFISGGTFNGSQTGMNNRICGPGFQKLQDTVASSAFHNSDERFDPPKCHPGTRTAVIERIMAWIRMARASDHGDNEPAQKLVMWLNGKAGAGKSAIAQNIAEECEAAGLLVASFFFNRSDPTRNHGRSLIPTIAYQITSIFPETRTHLEEIINCDPLIFKRSIEAQMLSLIVKPMQELATTPPTHLIIIDGLDECNNIQVQENILNVIASTVRQHHLPLIFLVASRPEAHITSSFNSFKFDGIYLGVELNDSFNPNADIRLFLQESFNEIGMTHRLRHTIPNPWPTPDTLDALVKKASGQFIYASVAIKFVKSPRHQPACQLDIILGLHAVAHEKPFAELDALYMHLFQSLEDIDTALMTLTFLCLQHISGYCSRSTSFISEFFNLEPQVLEVCISDLSSLLTITKTGNLFMSHASLLDFLFDPLRSGCFYADRGLYHAIIAKQCFIHLEKCESHKGPPYLVFGYSCLFLVYHCQNATMTEELRNQVCKFSCHFIPQEEHLKKSCDLFCGFLDWMEGQTWEGSQEAYTQISSQIFQTMKSEAQKYYAHPQTTLLITMVVNIIQKENPNPLLEHQILERLFGLHHHRQTLLKPMMLELEGDGMNLIHFIPSPSRIAQVLEETLDCQKYSVALLMLFRFLCDSHEHHWARSSHRPFKLAIHRTQPRKWQLMCKPKGQLTRARQFDKVLRERWKAWWRTNTGCPFPRLPALRAMKKLWDIQAYCLALRLVGRFLHRASTSRGEYDPQLIAFARRRTFAFTAMKLPRHKKQAKAAIARFLAEVDGEEN